MAVDSRLPNFRALTPAQRWEHVATACNLSTEERNLLTQAGALPATLAKRAYLGGFMELTLSSELGEIFVVSPDVAREWTLGEAFGLTLAGNGVFVVA